MKFKVWHKANKKFYGLHSIIFDSEGNIDLIRLKETNTFVKIDDVELLESTGFKDSEGNEIFEGDILTLQDLYEFRVTRAWANDLTGERITLLLERFWKEIKIIKNKFSNLAQKNENAE